MFSLLVQIVKNLILSMNCLYETLSIRILLILINFKEDITIKRTVWDTEFRTNMTLL